MKMPTGKNRNIMIGGAVVGGITLVWYFRKRSAANAAASSNSATADASAYDPNAIDPNTGLTYGQEDGFGFTPNGALGFGYAGSAVTSGGSASSGLGGTTYTSNTQWMSDAEQAAQNYYGASFSLATSALGKYISQDPKGLTDNEYSVVSEVVAQIGQPPVGQPYRLIHDNTPPPPSGGGTTPPPSGGGTTTPPPPSDNGGIPPGYHMQPPQVATLPALQSLRTYWQHHYPGNSQALTNLINYNPDIGVDWTAHGNILIRTSEAHLVPNN